MSTHRANQAAHLQAMSRLTQETVYALKKDMTSSAGGKKNTLLIQPLDQCYITDLEDERIFIGGQAKTIKRLFVFSSDVGDYVNVGWIVSSEIDQCMICNTTFGVFSRPHYCRACGNIVCDECSPHVCEIYEIAELGPMRVCNLCYWGQELVNASQRIRHSPSSSTSASALYTRADSSLVDAKTAELQQQTNEEEDEMDREIRELEEAKLAEEKAAKQAAEMREMAIYQPVAFRQMNANGDASASGIGNGGNGNGNDTAAAVQQDEMQQQQQLLQQQRLLEQQQQMIEQQRREMLMLLQQQQQMQLEQEAAAAAAKPVSRFPGKKNDASTANSTDSSTVNTGSLPRPSLAASRTLARASSAHSASSFYAPAVAGAGASSSSSSSSSSSKPISNTTTSSTTHSAATSSSTQVNNTPSANNSSSSSSSSNKLSSYGPITIVTPVPGFVVKTRRSTAVLAAAAAAAADGSSGTQAAMKVFVNFCTHKDVPYKPDVSVGDAQIDESKQMYMLLGCPMEDTNKKDNSYCIIYDVVVHPDEIYVCNIDPTGVARARLCRQGLELIAQHYKESLDPSFKILKVSSNYMHSSNTPQPIAMPAAEAFHFLVQLTTNLSDADGGFAREGKKNAIVGRGSRSGSSSSSSIIERDSIEREAASSSHRPSVLASNRLSQTFRTAGAAAADEAGEGQLKTGKALLSSIGTSIVAMVAPTLADEGSSEALAPNANLSIVLQKNIEFAFPLEDIIILPQAGFSVRAKTSGGGTTYVNICHHAKVGEVSQMPPLVEGDVPIVLGVITNRLNDRLAAESLGLKRDLAAKSIDVVVPSKAILPILHISQDEMRYQLAENVLAQLSRMRVRSLQFEEMVVLDNSTATTDYVGTATTNEPPVPSSWTGDRRIATVLNLTEPEKKTFNLSFVGKFYKQGHSVRNWKERYAFITNQQLKYFDMSGAHKGDFDIEDCIVTVVENNSDCGAPKGTFAFRIANFTLGGEFMFCYATSESLRTLFVTTMLTKTRSIAMLRDLLNVPPRCHGYMRKQGSMVKSWKRRFFVLSYGKLKYYANNGLDNSGSGEKELGVVYLKNHEVRNLSSARSEEEELRFNIYDLENNNVKMLIQAEETDEKQVWFDLLNRHCVYATEFG